MSPSDSAWPRMSLAFLISVVGVTELYLILESNFFLLKNNLPDSVALYQERMEPVRRALPPRGAVGYFGDKDGSADIVIAEYYFAQYTLAPVVLMLNKANLPFVIANFHDPDDQA